MKNHLFLIATLSICLSFVLVLPTAMALRFEFDSPDEISDWELGPDVTAEVKDGMLELIVGSPDSGIYFGEENWTDYTMEVHARKKDGDPYFHLFARVIEPAQDFYFMEISYNSNTTSLFMFSGATGTEITPDPPGRPPRPNSTDTDGGDAYTIVLEVEGDTIRSFIDGKLMVEATDGTYKNGRPGLGGRTSTVWYEYVEITGPGIDEGTTSVESTGKLAVTWGALKNLR